MNVTSAQRLSSSAPQLLAPQAPRYSPSLSLSLGLRSSCGGHSSAGCSTACHCCSCVSCIRYLRSTGRSVESSSLRAQAVGARALTWCGARTSLATRRATGLQSTVATHAQPRKGLRPGHPRPALATPSSQVVNHNTPRVNSTHLSTTWSIGCAMMGTRPRPTTMGTTVMACARTASSSGGGGGGESRSTDCHSYWIGMVSKGDTADQTRTSEGRAHVAPAAGHARAQLQHTAHAQATTRTARTATPHAACATHMARERRRRVRAHHARRCGRHVPQRACACGGAQGLCSQVHALVDDEACVRAARDA